MIGDRGRIEHVQGQAATDCAPVILYSATTKLLLAPRMSHFPQAAYAFPTQEFRNNRLAITGISTSTTTLNKSVQYGTSTEVQYQHPTELQCTYY